MDNLYVISKLLNVSMDNLVIDIGDRGFCPKKNEIQIRLNACYNGMMRLKKSVHVTVMFVVLWGIAKQSFQGYNYLVRKKIR